MEEEFKRTLINRLHRIEGQARGIENMIREQKDYWQIIQQLEALRSASNQIIFLLIEKRFCADESITKEDSDALKRFIASH